ncbi:unnamed protein product [Phytomonas sp. Hart1]|nr:unnamed protein product [Phytomonas sp. Hart1]|eukprot:CCW70876.1 unnamed protein product [Phytomonas sp. isolate Hart1]
MSSAAPKAFPKTLHQFRNFSYFVVAWLGLRKGYIEKQTNNTAWRVHRDKIRQQKIDRENALSSLKERPSSSDGIPSVIPKDLRGVYKDVAKSLG